MQGKDIGNTIGALVNLRRRFSPLLLAAGSVVVLSAAPVATAASPSGLNLTLKGSAQGKAVSGKVQFGSVTCAPLTGKGLQIIWSGSAKVGAALKQVSGDMHFSTTGKSTFSAHGSATASLVVAGNYSGRLGSTSGSATVAANRKTGTINVRLTAGTSKVQETGSWTC